MWQTVCKNGQNISPRQYKYPWVVLFTEKLGLVTILALGKDRLVCSFKPLSFGVVCYLGKSKGELKIWILDPSWSCLSLILYPLHSLSTFIPTPLTFYSSCRTHLTSLQSYCLFVCAVPLKDILFLLTIS